MASRQQEEEKKEKDRRQCPPEQTGGDQGDDERGDEDEKRDQEEEETKQPGGKTKTKRQRDKDSQCSNEQTVDQCEINQTPPGTIRLGLLNTRSMTKKAPRISELITQNNLDVFLTTETWLKHATADGVLSKASPQRFSFHSQVRAGTRGGGVSNQFSDVMRGKQIQFDSLIITTFEFVVTELQHDDWNQPVVIINLYHPPGNNKKEFRKFLDEFQSLLDAVKKNYSSFIVAGDFNIHVNKEWRSDTDEFDSLLQCNDLTQHVNEPTHKAGNTLDLVITSNVEISGLVVQDEKKVVKSDHYTVYFNAKPKDTTDKIEENKNEEQKPFRETEE
ncbi:uncharacterized protein AB9X84_003160 [Acanthopagrus schlegelii]